MAVYAIGDLQGCYSELRRLLDRLKFDAAFDRLWFTGDLVNRGPGSLECLRFVHSLGEAAVVVLGNHDLHLLARVAGRKPRRGDALDEVLAAPDRDALCDWLRRRPLMHEDARLGFTLVHAGLAPQWDLSEALACAREMQALLERDWATLLANMYGDEPDRWSPTLSGPERWRFIINAMTRLRFCTRDGRLLLKLKEGPAAAPPGALPWFKVPGRRTAQARILFGHWSTLGFYAGDGVVSLDSGCVWGGSLTAFRLDRELPPISVACAQAAPPGR
jgi:bis(5'-nucleosyl)-tetraphosphatase (symmetrical)